MTQLEQDCKQLKEKNEQLEQDLKNEKLRTELLSDVITASILP